MNSYRIKSAFLTKIAPHAVNQQLVARLDAHQRRIATDPEIRRIHEASRREQRLTSLLHLAIAAAIVGPVAWWISTQLLPALVG